MRPSGSLRRAARERARGIPFGRSDQPQLGVIRRWHEGEPAAGAADDAAEHPGEAVQPFLVGAIVVLALTFGGVVGLAGSGTLVEGLRAIGVMGETAMETTQRRQGAAIAALEEGVSALNAAVAGLVAHADFAGEREEASRRELARVDHEIGALKINLKELRTAQEAAISEEPWRRPVEQLGAALAKARTDITGLRSSLDEIAQGKPGAGAVGERIERLEKAMIQLNLLGGMRGAIHETGAKRRTATTADAAPIAAPLEMGDGHIISLTR